MSEERGHVMAGEPTGGWRTADPDPVYAEADPVGSVPFDPKVDLINHPPHYNTGAIEVIEYIEDKELPYHLGNVVKYVSRAGHKDNELEDLKKAQWYLMRYITLLEQNQ